MKRVTAPAEQPLEGVYAYHQRSKHAFGAYAKSPGYLDWATQPDPFRRFAGAPQVPLPLAADRQSALYAELFQPGKLPIQPITLENLGALLELSFGLSAWKQYGSERWALRCNPSSGNLHPTETYLVTPAIPHLAGGIYHYLSHDHALERRCQAELALPGLLVGLSSVHWREAWKYGERAFRYCQHDAGHAFAALRYAAGVLGWCVRLLDHWSDRDIAALLGLDRGADFSGSEPETPELIALVYPSNVRPRFVDFDALHEAVGNANWRGRANVLSSRHRQDWPAIEEISAACRKPRTSGLTEYPSHLAKLPGTACAWRAAELIRQRRSAQSFDGVTAIPAKAFYRMLDATLPRSDLPPFDGWPWPPRVHLALFVHRVLGLRPGLYVLCRREEALDVLRREIRGDFIWETPPGCPTHLRLFHLVRGDARQAAKALSCHQDIAADGAFSLGMLAEFDEALQEGSWVYRRLFWETGLVGQALYLEAEAAGVRGTGIGCFFDDPVHEFLGMRGTALQSLYHFTVGAPVQDVRLQTLPPYAHLERGNS